MTITFALISACPLPWSRSAARFGKLSIGQQSSKQQTNNNQQIAAFHLLTVAAAAMVIFVQSADAREHHHGHRHHHSLVASRGTSAEARSTPNGLFVLRPRTFLSSTTVYIGGATRRVRLPGAAGRCAISSAPIRGRHSIWRAIGRIGAGQDRREQEPWSCGHTMSARSSVSKTENGSSNPATTVMRFASALARSRARSRSGGLIALVLCVFEKQKAAHHLRGPF
jgi:hypothetical protein